MLSKAIKKEVKVRLNVMLKKELNPFQVDEAFCDLAMEFSEKLNLDLDTCVNELDAIRDDILGER